MKTIFVYSLKDLDKYVYIELSNQKPSVFDNIPDYSSSLSDIDWILENLIKEYAHVELIKNTFCACCNIKDIQGRITRVCTGDLKLDTKGYKINSLPLALSLCYLKFKNIDVILSLN